MTQIATIVYGLGIVGLFLLVRDPKVRTSSALWLPVVWLFLAGSRPVSVWLQQGPRTASMDMEGSPLDRNIYLALLTWGFIILWKRKARAVKFLRANPPILVFISYCAASVVWSDYPDIAFKRWIKSLGDIVMVLIVLTESQRSEAVKRLLNRTGFILLPLSVLLIKYYPEMSRYYSIWEGTMFVSGVALDKNMLGMICLIFGLGAWWQLLGAFREKRSKNRRNRMLAQIGVLVAMVWLFRMANSVTSESCFVVAAAVMTLVLLIRSARNTALLHLLVAGVVCVSCCALFLHVGGGALQALGRNSNLTGRTDIWKGVLEFGGNPILGTGFESFWLGDRMRRIWAAGGVLSGINESHDGYLEMFLNLGWIGVAIMAAIIIRGYRNIVRAVRQDPQTYCLQLAYFVAAIIYNFTEAAFKSMNPMWMLFIWSVLPVASARVGARSTVPKVVNSEWNVPVFPG
jgi:exopolysaccharide production protein ExoQ